VTTELLELSERLAAVAARAATCVADDLRSAFRAPMVVDFKRDEHDPVTMHDRMAEQRIRDVIAREVPDSVVVGEEAGTAGEGPVHWYVDPIDGTSNFASGVAFFCTSVGAVVDGQVVAGAIHDPMSGRLFTASLAGAWLDGAPLASRGADAESTALLVTSYPSARLLSSHGDVALDRLGRLIQGYCTVRRVGSAALSLAHVAAGWVDAAFGIGINPWDIAAARLLVHQAGGRFAPVWTSEPDARGDLFAPGYLATVDGLEPTLLREVANEIGVLGESMPSTAAGAAR
jgi:myo-inositol-1(or 4)-monophosphatase